MVLKINGPKIDDIVGVCVVQLCVCGWIQEPHVAYYVEVGFVRLCEK